MHVSARPKLLNQGLLGNRQWLVLFAGRERFIVFFRVAFFCFFPGRDFFAVCPLSLTGRTVSVRFDAISSSLSSMLSDSRSSVSSSISPSSSSSSSSSTDRTSGEASASLSCITASPSSPSVLLLKVRHKQLCLQYLCREASLGCKQKVFPRRLSS